MSDKWDEQVKAGSIPPPPSAASKNSTYSVTVFYADDGKEYERVRKVNMNPGFMVLQWSDREVIIPLTNAVRSIEISEDAILS